MFKSFWNKLNHKQKRITVAVGSLATIGAIVYFSGGSDVPDKKVKKRDEAIRSVLTDKSTRDISIDSLSASMRIANRENELLKKQIDEVTKELEKTKSESVKSDTLDKQLDELRGELAIIQERQEKAAASYAAPAVDEEVDEDGQPIPIGVKPQSQPDFEYEEAKTAKEIFQRAPAPSATKNSDTGERIPLKILSHAQPVEKKTVKEVVEEEVYIPSGSILTGVLLNGLDAPTGQGARRDPFPSALRIQKEAILPNRFRADVRECFMIVSGYGDLSTERAFMRGETISCIREDGGVIEARLNSYVVGEDGKAGMRGRLVSKQGQIIAKSLMAGFLGGVANAFDVNPVPVLSTSPSGTTEYQKTMSSDMLQGAAMKGASSALDRVAKFYIDMAESMFPVVEIDAGRQVDIIVTGGVSLKIRQ